MEMEFVLRLATFMDKLDKLMAKRNRLMMDRFGPEHELIPLENLAEVKDEQIKEINVEIVLLSEDFNTFYHGREHNCYL